MTPSKGTIDMSEVLKLPVQERIRIAEAIWDSIAEYPERIELQPWQADELDRRFAAYEANPAEGMTWEDIGVLQLDTGGEGQ